MKKKKKRSVQLCNFVWLNRAIKSAVRGRKKLMEVCLGQLHTPLKKITVYIMECVWRGRGGDLAAPGTVGKKWRSVESVPVKHRLQDAIALRTERVNSLQMRPEGVGEEAPTPYPRPPHSARTLSLIKGLRAL